MRLIDPIWCVGWFIAGAIVFQTAGKSKFYLSGVGVVFSLISFIHYQTANPSINSILIYIGITKISGMLTTPFYLAGANISRFKQFGSMSPRILLYILIIIGIAVIYFLFG